MKTKLEMKNEKMKTRSPMESSVGADNQGTPQRLLARQQQQPLQQQQKQ